MRDFFTGPDNSGLHCTTAENETVRRNQRKILSLRVELRYTHFKFQKADLPLNKLTKQYQTYSIEIYVWRILTWSYNSSGEFPLRSG